ncbi:unnamed protein product [Phaedon cochleariae]|uniref:ABC transporter domain-containing protein n=1 Tax=Phaedon cochleariae TaxID=80249 RepID=A0A9P0DGD9_PHACE|nr:unnamed protein product [Phaedon cochleariae]
MKEYMYDKVEPLCSTAKNDLGVFIKYDKCGNRNHFPEGENCRNEKKTAPIIFPGSISIKLNQLRVVLWKNLIIRKRHWLLTIIEASLPIVLFFLIAYGRSKISGLTKTEVTDPTYNEVNGIQYYLGIADVNILYSPDNEFTSDIIQRTLEKFQMPSDQVFGFTTPDALLENYPKYSNNTIIAIMFDTKNPKELIYTIRYYEPDSYKDQLPSTYKRYVPSYYMFTPSTDNSYIRKAFVPLQKALDFSFIERSMNISDIDRNVSLSTQEFPYPPYKSDTSLQTIFMEYLPLLTLFSFIFLCPAVLTRVVEEKHSGAKELLKMVGMKTWMIWLGWFIYAIIPILFSISCIVFLMKVQLFGSSYPLIEHTSAGILFIFLLLFCTAAVSLCFAISSCFSKPSNAVVAGILIWILSYFVPKYSLVLEESNSLSWLGKILLLLLPNMTLHYGYAAISVFEEREIGVQWNNFGQSSTGGSEDVTMLNVFVMLLRDTSLYLLFTFYMEAVNPGKYGIKKTKGFLIEYLWHLFSKTSEVNDDCEEVRLQNIEEGTTLHNGISIRKLKKQYGSDTVVDIEELNIHKNNITVLVGHNGAGKSTTMSMITGMIEPTSGMIRIDGLDTRESQDEIRKSLGLCPQHNLLFTDLTVGEHLVFFAKLKGKSSEEAEMEMSELLDKMNMSEKKNVLAHTLSGGMKRKLCLGMALIGGSKVLILDEPSSGMDPESRRQLWDLLLSWRGEKTILISTHFMEEADALGDWIAIMSEGSVQCYGTPMALKKDYHTGYHLSLTINGGANGTETKIKDLVGRTVVGSQFKSKNGNEMIFILPFEDTNNITELLCSIENKKEELKIENSSISITTLEDVFLKTRPDSEYIPKSISNYNPNQEQEDEKMRKWRKQILKLLEKRYFFTINKLYTYLIPTLIGFLSFGLTLYLTSSTNGYYHQNGPKLPLQLSTYKQTSVFYNASERNDIIEVIKTQYEKLVKTEGSSVDEVLEVEQAILDESKQNIAYYREHIVASASFFHYNSKIEAIALYNGMAVHSLPISLNLVTNAIAKTLLGSEYSISTSNWPLASINQHSSNEYSETKVVVLWLILIPIGCLFIHGSFIVFPHTEISTKFVQMQFMCGVKPYLYWLSNFVTDMLIYLVFILVMSVFMCIFFPPMHHLYEFCYLFLILFVYGLCGIPYSYLFSRKGSSSGAFALFIILGIFLGVIITLIVGVLLESQDDYYIRIGTYLKYLGSFFIPQVGLSMSLVEFCRRAVDNFNLQIVPKKLSSICSYASHPCCDINSIECIQHKDYMNLLLPNFVSMLAGCMFYLLIVIFLDSYLLLKRWSRSKYRLLQFIRNFKDNEKEIPINESEVPVSKENTLNVNRLSKTYSGNKIVNNIGLTLENGQCLGILGVNGAGKTTTFKLLTREEVLDNGSIKIKLNQKQIGVDEDEYMETLGYCPQSDNLNYVLTGRQILSTIAVLRGINDPGIVDEFLKIFCLEEIADKPCGHYSGGNKRKLSLAVSLIGFRKFILLDEPTNGVDPSARRKCWNIIKDMQDQKNMSFILTSHSMTECEALCDELKIMKGGKFVVENKLNVLKKEFGGYSLKIKLKNKGPSDEVDGSTFTSSRGVDEDYEFKDENDLKNYFTKNNRGEIKDDHGGLICIYIKNQGDEKKWSQIFEEIEDIKNKNYHLIEDYSIGEASLEDVFLEVAKSEDSLEAKEDHSTPHFLCSGLWLI